MRIAACQFSPEFGEKEKNLGIIAGLLRSAETDLVVLPELCTTGYQFASEDEVSSLCEPVPEGDSIRFFAGLCQEKGFFLVAGVGESEKGHFYNSSVLLGPEGFIGRYRKAHLFDEEKIWFSPGNSGFAVWDTGPAKIGMMICFDWIFPESARSLALMGCEVLCHPANLVLPYCQNAMITRSIENRIFSVTANRTGSEERGGKRKLIFTGGSQASGPGGELLFRMGEAEERVSVAEIDPGMARDKRITSRNHLFQDRRPEIYSLSGGSYSGD